MRIKCNCQQTKRAANNFAMAAQLVNGQGKGEGRIPPKGRVSRWHWFTLLVKPPNFFFVISAGMSSRGTDRDESYLILPHSKLDWTRPA